MARTEQTQPGFSLIRTLINGSKILFLLSGGTALVWGLNKLFKQEDVTQIDAAPQDTTALAGASVNSYRLITDAQLSQLITEAKSAYKQTTAPTIIKNKLEIHNGETEFLGPDELNSYYSGYNVTEQSNLVFQVVGSPTHGYFGNQTNQDIRTFTQEDINKKNQIYFKSDDNHEAPTIKLIVKTPDCPPINTTQTDWQDCTSQISSTDVTFIDDQKNKVPASVIGGVIAGAVSFGALVGAGFWGMRRYLSYRDEQVLLRNKNPNLYIFLNGLKVTEISETTLSDIKWSDAFNAILTEAKISIDELEPKPKKQYIEAMASACKQILRQYKITIIPENIETYKSEITQSLKDKTKHINLGRATLTSEEMVSFNA